MRERALLRWKTNTQSWKCRNGMTTALLRSGLGLARVRCALSRVNVFSVSRPRHAGNTSCTYSVMGCIVSPFSGSPTSLKFFLRERFSRSSGLDSKKAICLTKSFFTLRKSSSLDFLAVLSRVAGSNHSKQPSWFAA